MDLDAMRSIIAVAEKGSISKAAIHLNITQSALSRRIKALEDRYGYCFLDRTGTPGTLTPAGALLLDRARGFLRIEQELLRDLKALDNKGGISFCCTLPFGISYLSDILRDMVLEQGGKDEFKFVFKRVEEAVEGIRQRQYDLALIEHDGPVWLEGLHTCALPEDEIVFIAAPGLINEPFTDIGQLVRFRLYCKQEGSCSRALFESYLQKSGRTIDDFASRVFFDDFVFLVREVSAGKGISFLPRSIVRHDLERGELVAHPAPGGVVFSRSRTLAIVPEQLANRRLQPFIRRILATFDVPVPLCWDWGREE